LRHPSLTLARRTRIGRRILAAERLPPLDLASLLVEEGAAARATTLLPEE
jgi:hypothetical protein